MEEPAKVMEAAEELSSRENSPARNPPIVPKIQVKSQNPITKKATPSPPPGEAVSDQKGPSPPLTTRSPRPAERLRGGGGPAKSPRSQGETPAKSPRSQGENPSKSPRSRPQTPMRSPKTPSFVPPDVITPVFPASPEEMIGAQTSMETGLTYPYNIWGPITKYGYLDDVAPTWAQKHHFLGKHDKLAKKRLHARRFSHQRQPLYKELIEPEEKTCASYLDPKRKEFWRTDVTNVLHREMKARKDRHKRLLEYLNTEEMHRRSELQKDRDDRHQAYLDYDKNVKWYPGFRNNQSGAKYNIITKKPTDEYEEKRVRAENMKARYMLAKRGLYIQERMSGARPFDIISWRKIPNCRELPEWPEDIGPPPGPRHDENMIPLNASKGALSHAYPFGPFGTIANGR